jgi:hypothetical protein
MPGAAHPLRWLSLACKAIRHEAATARSFSQELLMLRHSTAAVVALLVMGLSVLAADKEVKCTLVKVDLKKQVITVKTEDGKEHNYDVNDTTKFVGPRGGVSDKGIKDDRLVKGAELTLVVAGNNRTLREVRLPERKSTKGQ